MRDLSFPSSAISKASLRISTSTVFLRRRRSSSQILISRFFASETGTRGFLALGNLISRLHLKSQWGLTSYFLATEKMLLAGCLSFLDYGLLLLEHPIGFFSEPI
jgi:hypothetical protein